MPPSRPAPLPWSAASWGFRRALQLELLLALSIAVFGFGAAADAAPWYQHVLPMTQLPGIVLLTEAGLCCGLGGGLVISDLVPNRYGGLTWVGVPILFVANVVGLGVGLSLGRALWLRARAPGR